MNAEAKPTYDEWFKERCEFGYDVDEDYLKEEVRWALNKVLADAGLLNVSEEGEVMNGQVLEFNDYSDINWSVGGYDDFVTFHMFVDPRKIPQGHELRLRYPFAHLADDLEFAYEHRIEPTGVRHRNSLTYEWQWTDQHFAFASDDEPFEMGTIYDGMDWELISKLMVVQTEELMEILKQYADDACYLVMSTLRADYDYYFSEERYNEEY